MCLKNNHNQDKNVRCTTVMMKTKISRLSKYLPLLSQESPSSQPYVQKIPKPSEGAHCRIHQPTFPVLNSRVVEEIIDEGIQKHHIKSK